MLCMLRSLVGFILFERSFLRTIDPIATSQQVGMSASGYPLRSAVIICMALALNACSDSSDTFGAMEPMEPSDLRLLYISEYDAIPSLSALNMSADLVVVGTPGESMRIDESASSRFASYVQSFFIEETLVGTAPSAMIWLLNSGADTEDEIVMQIFSLGGQLQFPLGGFGQLRHDRKYVLFLLATNRSFFGLVDSPYVVNGELSQGAFSVDVNEQTKRFSLDDVLDPFGNEIVLFHGLELRIERPPALSDYNDGDSLELIRARLAE